MMDPDGHQQIKVKIGSMLQLFLNFHSRYRHCDQKFLSTTTHETVIRITLILKSAVLKDNIVKYELLCKVITSNFEKGNS